MLNGATMNLSEKDDDIQPLIVNSDTFQNLRCAIENSFFNFQFKSNKIVLVCVVLKHFFQNSIMQVIEGTCKQIFAEKK